MSDDEDGEPKERTYRVRLEFSGYVDAIDEDQALSMAREEFKTAWELVDWDINPLRR